MSSAAPVAHTGNLPHAVVFALPIRDDGKIYTGQVTFTASKPIEVEVIHIYKPDQPPDEVHGEPPTAVINGTTITYSHLTGIVDNNIIIEMFRLHLAHLNSLGVDLYFINEAQSHSPSRTLLMLQ